MVFLTRDDVLTIHEAYLEAGQLIGVKFEAQLQSAVGRVMTMANFDSSADIAKLAATYWHGITMNHAFHDGNKRAGFFSMLTFLEANGFEFVGKDEYTGEAIYEMFEADRFTLDNLHQIVTSNMRPLV